MRCLGLLVGLIGLGGATIVGAASAPALLTADELAQLPPDVAAEIQALVAPSWRPSLTLRVAAGYRDNVLLSRFEPVGRPFLEGELELFLARPVGATWEVVGFLNGEGLRYLSPPKETGGEQAWFAMTGVRWKPVAWLTPRADVQGYWQDEVLDLSDTEAERVVARTRVGGAIGVVGLRFDLPGRVKIEPLVQVQRSAVRDYPGDYDEVKTGGRAEWSPGAGFTLSTAAWAWQRSYAERPNYTAGGRPRAGTHLRFHQREWEAGVARTWRTQATWTAAVKGGEFQNRDGAGGFFDYRERKVRAEGEVEGKRWRWHLEGAARRQRYDVQTVGMGLEPPARIQDVFEFGARAEWKWSETWTVFIAENWERCRSNEDEFNYRTNTVLAGVEREF